MLKEMADFSRPGGRGRDGHEDMDPGFPLRQLEVRS
jgi:hypothetical protein